MASWVETGRGPGTWPSGLGGDAAAAGADGDLRSASPCGSFPGRRSPDDDASLRSTHRCPYHLRTKTKGNQRGDSVKTAGSALNKYTLRYFDVNVKCLNLDFLTLP